MTATKNCRPCAGTQKRHQKQSIGIASDCIVSLTRASVKLAITADLVLLLATLGSLNIPAIVCTVMAFNALCGLILKKEENIHENV